MEMRYVLMSLVLVIAPLPLRADTLASMWSCRSEPDDRQRLACYDRALDETPVAAEVSQPPSRQISAEDVFGRDSAASANRLFGVRSPDDVRSVVADLEWAPDGKLLISLQNGHVWTQSDTARLDLARGDAVVIRKAQLGSFMLRRADGNRSIRVRRVD
jgi:hypothetical protein